MGSSGQSRRIFSAFCSNSSFTWASTSMRPFQVRTASATNCAMTQLLPAAVGSTTAGLSSRVRRCSHTASTAACW